MRMTLGGWGFEAGAAGAAVFAAKLLASNVIKSRNRIRNMG
jgi:hypothetical protein